MGFANSGAVDRFGIDHRGMEVPEAADPEYGGRPHYTRHHEVVVRGKDNNGAEHWRGWESPAPEPRPVVEYRNFVVRPFGQWLNTEFTGQREAIRDTAPMTAQMGDRTNPIYQQIPIARGHGLWDVQQVGES